MGTLKRTAIAVCMIVLGIGVTIVGIKLVWSDDYGLLGTLLTPVWAGTLVGGAYLFPEAMGELGHPLAWVIGIALNGLFLAAIAAGVLLAIKRVRKQRRPNDIRAT